MKTNAVRDHLFHRQFPHLGAAITPNSRSSPGTHTLDCPDSVGGREGRGISSVLPPGDFFRRPIRLNVRPKIGVTPVILLLALLLPIGRLSAQRPIPVERTARSVAPTPDTVEGSNTALPTVETLRPDEPVDLALETYLRRDRLDSTLFTPREREPAKILGGQELDSLNPHGKEGEITIPIRGYPAPDDPPRPEKPFYLEGAIGLNTTATVRAGMSGRTWPFNYHGRVDFLSTDGHVDNAGESRLTGVLGGGYVIGMDYGIFSGGYMGAEVGYDRRSWRLYALESAPERTLNGWHMEGETTAGIDRFDLNGRARVMHVSFEQSESTSESTSVSFPDPLSIGMTSAEGELEVKTSTGSILWDGMLDLRMTSAAGIPLNFGSFDLRAGLDFGIVRLRAGGRVGVADGSDGESRTSLTPSAELRIAPFNGVALVGSMDGGLHQITPAGILEINRYALLDGPWIPEEERRGYEVSLTLAPSTAWGFRGSASRRDFDSRLHFESVVNGEFIPHYDKISIDRIDADFFVNLTTNDRIAGLVAFSDGLLSDGRAIPYIPRWDAEIFYHRRLFNIPSTAGGSIRYIGPREGTSRTLDQVLLISLDWSYTVAGLFDAVLTARNVLGTSWELWEGYEERGFFLSLGVRARL